jgi:hypothetical protein
LVKGLGKIAISPDHSISNVFLVDSLDYNLLSVSQLCQMGYNCLFTDIGVTVFRRSDDSIAFKGVLGGQLYLVNFRGPGPSSDPGSGIAALAVAAVVAAATGAPRGDHPQMAVVAAEPMVVVAARSED